MQKIPHIELNEICYQLGEGSPKSIKQVFGGDIHTSWQVEFQNAKFFLKRNERKLKFLKFNLGLYQLILFLHLPVRKNSSILSIARFAIAVLVFFVALPK